MQQLFGKILVQDRIENNARKVDSLVLRTSCFISHCQYQHGCHVYFCGGNRTIIMPLGTVSCN